MIRFVLLTVVVLSVLALCYHHHTLSTQKSVSDETMTTVVHGAILKSLQASRISDPHTALINVREAVATIEAAEKLSHDLSTSTGVDVERVKNTLRIQEQSIRSALAPESKNPLETIARSE